MSIVNSAKPLNNNLSSVYGSVLAPAGADHVADVHELFADGFQLLDIFDLEADGEGAAAAGEVPAEQLLHPDPGGGHTKFA